MLMPTFRFHASCNYLCMSYIFLNMSEKSISITDVQVLACLFGVEYRYHRCTVTTYSLICVEYQFHECLYYPIWVSISQMYLLALHGYVQYLQTFSVWSINLQMCLLSSLGYCNTAVFTMFTLFYGLRCLLVLPVWSISLQLYIQY